MGPFPVQAQEDDFDFSFDFLVEYAGWKSVFDVVLFALFMALAATLLWIAYRTMERPRLPVIRTAEAPPRATWTGLLRYAVTIPFLVWFWMAVMFLLLATVSGTRTAATILVISSGVIGGARLLAHINPEIAHELAKSVPIVILGLIIIGNGFVGFERFEQALDDLPENLSNIYAVGLIIWDYLLTLTWYLAIRWRWRRRQRRTAEGGPAASWPKRVWERINQIGYD
jgi:hypothetical protein